MSARVRRNCRGAVCSPPHGFRAFESHQSRSRHSLATRRRFAPPTTAPRAAWRSVPSAFAKRARPRVDRLLLEASTRPMCRSPRCRSSGALAWAPQTRASRAGSRSTFMMAAAHEVPRPATRSPSTTCRSSPMRRARRNARNTEHALDVRVSFYSPGAEWGAVVDAALAGLGRGCSDRVFL